MSVGDVADGRRDAIEEHGGLGARTGPDDRLWDLAEGEASTGIGAHGTLDDPDDLDDFDDLDEQDDQEQLDGFEESGEEHDGTDEYGTEFDDYQR
jgi:hypothetical protein